MCRERRISTSPSVPFHMNVHICLAITARNMATPSCSSSSRALALALLARQKPLLSLERFRLEMKKQSRATRERVVRLPSGIWKMFLPKIAVRERQTTGE